MGTGDVDHELLKQMVALACQAQESANPIDWALDATSAMLDARHSEDSTGSMAGQHPGEGRMRAFLFQRLSKYPVLLTAWSGQALVAFQFADPQSDDEGRRVVMGPRFAMGHAHLAMFGWWCDKLATDAMPFRFVDGDDARARAVSRPTSVERVKPIRLSRRGRRDSSFDAA